MSTLITSTHTHTHTHTHVIRATKPIKHCHSRVNLHHRLRRNSKFEQQTSCLTMVDFIAASLLASISTSILNCHHRVHHLFSTSFTPAKQSKLQNNIISSPTNKDHTNTDTNTDTNTNTVQVLKKKKKKTNAISLFKKKKKTDDIQPFNNDIQTNKDIQTKKKTKHVQIKKKQTKTHIPIPIPPKKKTIFLDLDETLVHCTSEMPDVPFDFTINPIICGHPMMFYVVKRPGLDHFLQKIADKYEVVLFTAGLREYAMAVLDQIDTKGLIVHRLFRDSCTEVDGKYIKDLGATGRDLANVVIVDDNPNAYALQPENALRIKPFFNDMKDVELNKLVHFFNACLEAEDTRVAIKEFLNKRILLRPVLDA